MPHCFFCCFPFINLIKHSVEAPKTLTVSYQDTTPNHQLNHTETSFMHANVGEKTRLYGSLGKQKGANTVKSITGRSTPIPTNKIPENLRTIMEEGEFQRYSFSEHCSSSYLNPRF